MFEAEARDGTHCALKVFRPESESRILKDRFLSEARLLETIYHPRIVRVHDHGIDEVEGVAWMAMDLVLDENGGVSTLEDVRKRGGVEEATLRMWFEEATEAFEYLHGCGIVHRDVKLENMLVDGQGHVRLADFGVSRIVDERLRGELGVCTTFVTGETTGTCPVMGTYFYLPPDVRSGAPATAAADRYALGVAFFRLLTGLWYEPESNALDLLAPFAEYWRKELPKLLCCADGGNCWRGAMQRNRRRNVRRGVFAATTAIAIAVAIAALWHRSSATESEWQLPKSFAVPLVKSLPLGDGCEMEFCACQAGAFMMSNVGNEETSCHKVSITRPFWIGRTVLTARQFRLEKPDAVRDKAASDMEASFPEMNVACRLNGNPIREYIRWLNMKYGIALPRGYVFRLPTEAELEYAIREGGGRPGQHADIWWDTKETKRRVESAGMPFRNDLRLVPNAAADVTGAGRAGHRFGLATLWTDTEQTVLDTADGKPGTKTARNSIIYAAEETDPVRSGTLHLSRQACFQRWLMKEPSGFVRICIGPELNARAKPPQEKKP